MPDEWEHLLWLCVQNLAINKSEVSADIEKFEDGRSSKFLWMLTSFLYKYFQLGQNSQRKQWQKFGFVETTLWLLWPLFTCLFIAPPDCISDFCDHPIWQPGIWQAQISLSANSAFYLFFPFSALVHGQTNFVTGFENIMFSLTVSWLYRCNILRALPYQKLFVLNWCSVVWWPLKVLLGNKFEEHHSWIQSGRVRF